MITGEIILQYKDQMYRICNNILKDSLLAEDVVLIAIEKAWVHREQFDPSKAQANTWLCTIAKNEALQLSSKLKKTIPLDDLALEQLTDGIEEDTYDEDQIKIKSDYEKAMFAIQKRFKRWPGLAEKFVEYYTSPKSENLHDIALMYNLPDNTIRTQFRRAKLESISEITGVHYTQRKEKKRRIDMLTKDGQYIRTFDSAKKASEWLNKGTLGMIYIANVASGLTKRHSAYKYQWKWTDEL